MHIGILQTGHPPEAMLADHGDYGELFPKLLAGRGLSFSTWSVIDGAFPDSIHDAEGWLLTGSRHGVYDDLPWIAPLEDFIRAAYDAAIPILGICFGHQIVAQALGGRVEKFSGGWAVGRQVYAFDNGLGQLALNAWHQDQVTVPPPGARVIASNDFCRIAGLAYGDRAYTVQPHPEFDASFVKGLIDSRGRGLVPEPLLRAAERDLAKPTDAPAFADSAAAFFLRARQAGDREMAAHG